MNALIRRINPKNIRADELSESCLMSFSVFKGCSFICGVFCWMEYAIPAREHAMPIIAKGKA